MKHDLTIVYVTARKEPCIEWFFDSLGNQIKIGDEITLIIVDYHAFERSTKVPPLDRLNVKDVWWGYPKPNVWQGQHRFTKKEWWAKSAYINTGVCRCRTEWIAFVDDRSVLMPTWLSAVKHAMDGNYAVCGAYEKRTGMTVEGGFIKHGGIIIGEDPRRTNSDAARLAPGGHWFGCTNALPLEWMLAINGADENCDSLGMEDVIMGRMLEANGFPIKYDPRMKIVEDRSPEFYEAAVGRTDKGQSPNDKSHGLLKLTAGKKQSTHHWNLREIRQKVLNGEPFPVPIEPVVDWFDGKPLHDFP